MRQLAKGQTVLFFVNSEVQSKIRTLVSKPADGSIEVADVLKWAMHETFAETWRAIPIWAVQGERFLIQAQYWQDIYATGTADISRSQVSRFLEQERHSLEDRYRPSNSKATTLPQPQASSLVRTAEIRERCAEFGTLQSDTSALQEEQERELSPEIEHERQVERPASACAAAHQLDPDVTLFVLTGKVISSSQAYMPAFQALRDTDAASRFQLSQLPGSDHLLVTADFARTIQMPSKSSRQLDAYQRGVQWVLTTRPAPSQSPYLMVISPFEAERLIGTIQTSPSVALHLYKPRCNASHPTFDSLGFLTIPSGAPTYHIEHALLCQLNVFAGQLYLNSYADYVEVCTILGLAFDVPRDGEVMAADGFVVEDIFGARPGTSPVKFLQALMSRIRRNGRGIGKTDMGNILSGKILQRSDFESRIVDTA